jgi:hypothetical protein
MFSISSIVQPLCHVVSTVSFISQIPPDLVVKPQGIDIISVNLCLI